MPENDENPTADEPQFDPVNLIMIVVGAHLRAEMADRPLAYQLRDRIGTWLTEHDSLLNVPLLPVVCSDIWFVNQSQFHHRPTISLGGPGVNALSAYFAQKLYAACVRDDQIVIQLDPEFTDLRACIWGMNHELTVEALAIFDDRYLDDYLRAVATQVEPQV